MSSIALALRAVRSARRPTQSISRIRAATAPVRFVQRHDVQTRDGGEQSTRLLADLLAVKQVTGVVPGDPAAERARLFAHPEVAEEFGRVLDLRGKRRSPSRPQRVVL